MRVVPVGDADVAVRPVAAGAAQHERDHARHVGLEGDHLQVHHQLGVIFERFRRGIGPLHRRNLHLGVLLLGLLDAPLDVADRFQVLAELVAVARAELGLQPVDAARDVVENAALFLQRGQARRRIGALAIAEQAFEHARGLTSTGSGVVGLRQETVLV